MDEDSRITVISSEQAGAYHNYAAFYVEGQSCVYQITNNQIVRLPGRQTVDANNYFLGRLLREALHDLGAHLRDRMDDMTMYDTEAFWKDALKYAGRTILPHALWVDYRRVPYGYLIVRTSDCEKSLCYSLADNARVPSDGKHTATAMELCYHGLLDQLLAQRHAEAEIAPAAYTETAGINGFLKHKRSVNGVWKDGSMNKSYDRDPMTADCLFRIHEGRIDLNRDGYRNPSSKEQSLPTAFRHYATEYAFDAAALESLAVENSDPAVRDEMERNQLISKISSMIPSGSWLPFCKIELTTGEGYSETVFHPSNPYSRDDLLKLDAVKDFLRNHCDNTALRAECVHHCIGTGSPAPMPDEVFALLMQLGRRRWREIYGYGEGSPRITEFDAGLLYDLFYGKDEVPWEKESALLLGNIRASIPKDARYVYSTVQIFDDNGIIEDVVSGEICDEDAVRELPLFRAFCEKHQEIGEVCVITRCFEIGRGDVRGVPEDALVLIKEYGAEVLAHVGVFSCYREKRLVIETEKYADDGIATNLMPPSVREKLKANRLYSKDGQGKNAEVVVKYFNPSGVGTWLITEGEEQENGDWLLFGMCHLFEWEWGYVMLSDLQSIKAPPFDLGIERDLYASGTVEEMMGDDDDD